MAASGPSLLLEPAHARRADSSGQRPRGKHNVQTWLLFTCSYQKNAHLTSLKKNLKWPCSNHCTSISHPKELDLLLIFPKNNRNCIQNFFYKLPHKGCAFYNISWTCMYLYFKTKILDSLHESCWYNVLVLILVF